MLTQELVRPLTQELTQPLAGYTGESGVQPWAMPGCACWYRRQVLETLGDGALVASWEDASPNGRHASQASTPLQPVVDGDAENGQAAADVDGADDRLDIAIGTTVPAGDWTFYFVGEPEANTRCGLLATSATLPDQPLVFGVSRTLVSWNAGGWRHIGVPDTHRRVVSVVLTAGVGGEAWVDGVSVGTEAYPEAVAFAAPGHMFTAGGSADPFKGLAEEFGLFSGAHDASTRASIEPYLAELYLP